MQWHEFKALLCGIGPDTSLGRIVSIRLEDDNEVSKSLLQDKKRSGTSGEEKPLRQRQKKKRMIS